MGLSFCELQNSLTCEQSTTLYEHEFPNISKYIKKGAKGKKVTGKYKHLFEY